MYQKTLDPLIGCSAVPLHVTRYVRHPQGAGRQDRLSYFGGLLRCLFIIKYRLNKF